MAGHKVKPGMFGAVQAQTLCRSRIWEATCMVSMNRQVCMPSSGSVQRYDGLTWCPYGCGSAANEAVEPVT